MKIMKTTANRWIAVGTLGVLTLGSTLAASTPAQAISSKTWKKAAIGAGVVTGYGLLKGKGRVATIGGIATAGSYYMYKRQQKKENRNNNRRRYNYRRR
jgi:hypothetical protein